MHPISALVLLDARLAKPMLWEWLTLGLEQWLRLGKNRPFKHERQKGVWSGFQRDFVTCSPYVSAFHQLRSDLKQVASLPNKPQLLQHLLRCNLCCQCVKSPYMGQSRDRLTHELCQRGGKKAVVCSVQEGSWPYVPFWGCFLGEALRPAWFTFCFYDEQNIDSDLSVCTHRGPLEEPVCTSDWVPDRTALLPGEEWISSQGFCQLLSLERVGRPQYHVSATDGHFSKAWGDGIPTCPGGLRWFYCFWVQVWKQ